jgi:PAS domain S-box-containing protein
MTALMTGDRARYAAQRLAAIVESSDDAIVSKDLNGIVTSWNRAAEQMFGYTPAEAIGRPITFIIPDDRLAEEDHVLAKIRAGERVDHFETIRRRKDGTEIPVALTISPVRDETGTIVGASKIARDVSERKVAETRLVELEQARADLQRRLLTLVEASGAILGSPRLEDVLDGTISLARGLVEADGYALWRLDEVSREWRAVTSTGLSDQFTSEALSELQSVPTDALLRGPIASDDVLSDARLAHRREAYAREGIRSAIIVPLAVRGKPTGTLVFYARRPRSFSAVERQTAHALGNLVASAIAAAELYDEQRQSREQSDFLVGVGNALASSLDYEETLRIVAKLAVPAIADWCAVDIVDKEGALRRLAVAHVDPAKVRLARTMQERYSDPASPYSVETVVRTGVPVLLPSITDAMITAAAGGDAERARLVRAIGLHSYMCVPLVAQRRTIGAISFVSAESMRHFTASDLRFAAQVAERAALAMENTRAYSEAREASRLKDEFLATLSHELRTPLNTILGYAKMLRGGVVAPEKHTRALEIVERNATLLAQIVGDVLDVSRIISGKLRLEVQPVDPALVIREAIETVRPAAEAKAIRLVTTVEPLDRLPHADPSRLQQVVWNLLSNAVKFTPAGGRIDVRVLAGARSADIEVSDTGIGIAPEFLPYVFDRFRQADSRFSREHGGLGLGLAIARHIVEMHGGRIEALSEGTGQGSTFRVRLPVSAARERADVAPAVSPRGLRQQLIGVRVLAVDDQEDALAMVRDALESAGAHVDTALAAEEAIHLIESTPPDVLLADIGLPGMDGLELIRRVRQSGNSRTQRLPAAAISAYARNEDRDEALASGFQLHVPKPVDPLELVRIVGTLVGRD